MTKIEVGGKYYLGFYKSAGSKRQVTVTSIEPTEKAWYDDHQGGGWWATGVVNVVTESGHVGWESLQYAEENWLTEWSEDTFGKQASHWDWCSADESEE